MTREMKTHPAALIVRPTGDGITSEMATTISLEDEGGGPYVIVEQHGRSDLGKVAFERDEWPAIRAAVDQMMGLCDEIEAEATIHA